MEDQSNIMFAEEDCDLEEFDVLKTLNGLIVHLKELAPRVDIANSPHSFKIH
jgi:hypothetical protein